MEETDIIQAAKRLYWTGKSEEEKKEILSSYPEQYRKDIKEKAAAMERADDKGNEIYKQEKECHCPYVSPSRFF